MSIPKNVLTYLDGNRVKYEVVEHRKVFTAFDVAATLHVTVSQIAKNLLVKAGSGFVLAVVPASRNIDFVKLAKIIGLKTVSLPKEGVMKSKFKVKPGALPGFGGLYKIPVYVDKQLIKEKMIIISSGSYTESIVMKSLDYMKLEQAELCVFSVARKVKQAKKSKTKAKIASAKKPRKK